MFIDILGTNYDRAWQRAWQDFLGRCLAYDAARRPELGRAMGEELAVLLEQHPLDGALGCAGAFGTPTLLAGVSTQFVRQVTN